MKKSLTLALLAATLSTPLMAQEVNTAELIQEEPMERILVLGTRIHNISDDLKESIQLSFEEMQAIMKEESQQHFKESQQALISHFKSSET